MVGTQLRQVALVDMSSGTTTDVLSHPQWNLYWASFSPDESEIVFMAKTAPDRSQIFVSAFHDGHCDPAANWIPITTDSEYNGPAHWSPDGSRIYFTSQRDGYRCLYARQWDRRRRTPVGPVVGVRHFHTTSPSPGLVDQPVFGFAVAQDKIVIEVGERRGRIWLVR